MNAHPSRKYLIVGSVGALLTLAALLFSSKRESPLELRVLRNSILVSSKEGWSGSGNETRAFKRRVYKVEGSYWTMRKGIQSELATNANNVQVLTELVPTRTPRGHTFYLETMWCLRPPSGHFPITTSIRLTHHALRPGRPRLELAKPGHVFIDLIEYREYGLYERLMRRWRNR